MGYIRESYIENKVCLYAEYKGWTHYKWQSPGNKGVPDRIFLKEGKIIFIEFKAPREEPRKLQLFVHKMIRKCGFEVYIVDDIDYGRMVINKYS